MVDELEVAILSNDTFLRDGLAHILKDRGLTVSSAASEPSGLNFKSRESTSRVIIIDTPAPVEAGFYASLQRAHERAYLVVLSPICEVRAVVEAFGEGVRGYLLKDTSLDVLVSSVNLIALGETVVPAEIVAWFAERIYAAPFAHTADLTMLTDREVSILQLLTEGACNKLIGRRLGIQEATVKVHMKAALRKLGLANRTQAAIWALQNGVQSVGKQWVQAADNDKAGTPRLSSGFARKPVRKAPSARAIGLRNARSKVLAGAL